jgi:hypothetical protein
MVTTGQNDRNVHQASTNRTPQHVVEIPQGFGFEIFRSVQIFLLFEPRQNVVCVELRHFGVEREREREREERGSNERTIESAVFVRNEKKKERVKNNLIVRRG